MMLASCSTEELTSSSRSSPSIGPGDPRGGLVEHLLGREQGLGGRELALGGGLVGLAER